MELLKISSKKIMASIPVLGIMLGILFLAVDVSYLVPSEFAYLVIIIGVIVALIVLDLFLWRWRRIHRQTPTELPKVSYNQGDKHSSKEANSDKQYLIEWQPQDPTF